MGFTPMAIFSKRSNYTYLAYSVLLEEGVLPCVYEVHEDIVDR
jgi:hypothetical protein